MKVCKLIELSKKTIINKTNKTLLKLNGFMVVL